MKFILIPILSTIEELYQQPISRERFKTYLQKLQGDTKADMQLPIAGFNPMAKEHVLDKLKTLQSLNAEQIMQQALEEINDNFTEAAVTEIKVLLNLADDLKGAWTNFYTTDFDNKFKMNGLVRRGFCTPYFWSSESYSEALIRSRTLSAAYRTIYWLQNGKPETLEDHVNQEVFVCRNMGEDAEYPAIKEEALTLFYQEHHQSEEYNLIFNFFYGDAAAISLTYPTYGIEKSNGFEYARHVAIRSH